MKTDKFKSKHQESRKRKGYGNEPSHIGEKKFKNTGHRAQEQVPRVRDPNRVTNYSKNQAKRQEKEENLKMYRHKVFIDGLPFQRSDETDAELYDLCYRVRAKGAIRLVQKKGYGFGYLVFHTNEQAKRAVQLLSGQSLYGRSLRVEVPKAPDASKSENQEDRTERVKSMFQRQILLLSLPKFINEEILTDALRDYFRNGTYQGSVEGIKVLRREKAFVTFTPDFADRIQEILSYFAENPLQILGSTVEAVRALSPNETCGRPPVEATVDKDSEAKSEEGPAKKAKEPKSAEQEKLRRMTKSKKSYVFLLQEVGEVSDPKMFREQFCDRFEIEDEDDVIELSSVRTKLHGKSTGLWKVNVRRYLVAQKMLAMCTHGKEEGKVKMEISA